MFQGFIRQGATFDLKTQMAVDATDGFTHEAGLAGSFTCFLSKNSGGLTARNSATAIALDLAGSYDVELDGTDTDTVGRLDYRIYDATPTPAHRPLEGFFVVLPKWVYDLFIGQALEAGTAQSGSTTNIRLRSGATTTDDFHNGALVFLHAGTGAPAFRVAEDYDGTLKDLTPRLDFVTAPDSSTEYVIFPASSPLAALWAALRDLTDGVESNLTIGNLFRFIASAVASEISGLGTIEGTLRDYNDTKDRIVADIDSKGNRSGFTTRDGS